MITAADFPCAPADKREHAYFCTECEGVLCDTVRVDSEICLQQRHFFHSFCLIDKQAEDDGIIHCLDMFCEQYCSKDKVVLGTVIAKVVENALCELPLPNSDVVQPQSIIAQRVPERLPSSGSTSPGPTLNNNSSESSSSNSSDSESSGPESNRAELPKVIVAKSKVGVVQCRFCTETFGNRATRKRHESKIHLNKKYACPACGTTFVMKVHFNRKH